MLYSDDIWSRSRRIKLKEHICDFAIDFDGNIVCYICYKINWEETEKFWNDYRNGTLVK